MKHRTGKGKSQIKLKHLMDITSRSSSLVSRECRWKWNGSFLACWWQECSDRNAWKGNSQYRVRLNLCTLHNSVIARWAQPRVSRPGCMHTPVRVFLTAPWPSERTGMSYMFVRGGKAEETVLYSYNWILHSHLNGTNYSTWINLDKPETWCQYFKQCCKKIHKHGSITVCAA